MKLYYWKGPDGIKRNFGDELNKLIWPHYLPDVFDNDPAEKFIGIGTLLNNGIPPSQTNIVVGAGVGYGALPDMKGAWEIYCVRGPMSAKALKLDKSLAIIDPGVLVNRLLSGISLEKKWKYGYMPHWINSTPVWKEVCDNAGWVYIDPLWEVDRVLKTLGQTECLVAEAMHGAIVADAMGIPWIAAIDEQNAHTLPFKWLDWCASINVKYVPVLITGVKELYQEHYQKASAAEALKEVVKLFKKIEKRIKPVLSKRVHLEKQEKKLEDVIMQFRMKYKKSL